MAFHSSAQSSSAPLLGTVLTVESPLVAQIAAQIFDWVMIDMEHSPLSAMAATHMVHAVTAASNGSCLPIVRVPSHGVEWIKWALDSGAAGLIVPMVNNAAEMEGIINRAIYPPRGNRSFGPFNAPFGMNLSSPDFGEYYNRAQRHQLSILPIIESKEGVENAEAILSLDGVSGAFIGPYDLRLSLGLPGGIDGPELEFTEALRKICDLGKKLGKPIGSMGVGSSLAKSRANIGMQFLLVTIDYNILISGFSAAKRAALDGIHNVEG